MVYMPADNKAPKQVQIEFHLTKPYGAWPSRVLHLMESFVLNKGGYKVATLGKA